jgi:hypothetical protein
MEQENSFLHKLGELTGDSRSVRFDTILDVILYIKKNIVTEANFIIQTIQVIQNFPRNMYARIYSEIMPDTYCHSQFLY